MKKIFTLITAALATLSVSAQETALFENGGTYGNGATLTTENCKVVLGNDRTNSNYDVKLASVKAYCAGLFGQTVMLENSDTGEMEEKTRVVYVVGNQNPKDGELDGDKSTGSGYNPTKFNLPQSGTYYMITPTQDGHITAFIVLNAAKNIYVVKGSNGENLPVADLTIKADGDEPVATTINDDFTIDEKTTGTIEFDVVANETYYLFCTGSKLSFGGYKFEGSGAPTPQPGESNVDTDPALPVTFNSWDANFLILKTGVVAGDQFVFTGQPIDVEGWEWGPQILPKSNADWTDLGAALIPNADGVATFTVTEEYAKVINDNGGLRVQGMGVIVTAVNYVTAKEPQPEGDKVSIIDKFTGTWKESETQTHNADGSITFNSVAWGGLSAWLAENDTPVDWSKYIKLVFVYAEPTTVNTQGFVQCADPDDPTNPEKSVNNTWWGNTGITSLECPFDGKDMSKVRQVALQASDVATINITDIYLVQNADGIEEMISVKDAFNSNAPIYNLSGVRVNKDYKGIVIQNGRKFIQK